MTTATQAAADGTYPRFTHDCENCRFLGQHRAVDLYFCGNLRPTVVARASDEGADYTSGMSFGYGLNANLTEARRRAQALGFVKYDLFEAVRYARNLNGDDLLELKTELNASELGQMLLRFEKERCGATGQALRDWVHQRAAVVRSEHPTASKYDILSWARQNVVDVFDGLRCLDQLQTLSQLDLAQVLYAEEDEA
jgi:hypothetical protein